MLRNLTPRSRTGLSILGLVGALMFVAMLASLAIPAFFARPDVTLQNAALLLRRDIKDIQNQAVFNFESTEMRFLEGGDGYTGHHRDGTFLVAPAGPGDFKRKYSFDAVFRGVVMDEVDLGGEPSLWFDPRGHALSGARIVLAYNGATCVVTVEEGSGRIAVGPVVPDGQGPTETQGPAEMNSGGDGSD